MNDLNVEEKHTQPTSTAINPQHHSQVDPTIIPRSKERKVREKVISWEDGSRERGGDEEGAVDRGRRQEAGELCGAVRAKALGFCSKGVRFEGVKGGRSRASGLYRTGKSCRLRWLNYLHPGLKHTPMTPEEETLILELHAHWGNRWSRIARELPGRTDNEIKNFWRTYMRKIARENKRKSVSTSSSYHINTAIKPRPGKGEAIAGSSTTTKEESDIEMTGYPMEKIWDEISGISETIVNGKNNIEDYPNMLSQWEDCLESFDTGQDQVEDEDFMAFLDENSWFQNSNMENNLFFKYDCVHMTSINKCMICSK